MQIAQAIIAQGHTINGIFFYQDGVINANISIQTPSDEINLLHAWQTFHQTTSTPLHLCITAAERRGLTDGSDDHFANIDKTFTISGLGELVVLTSGADKVIQL